MSGESVLTADSIVADGLIEVRLGEGQQQFSWDSELPVGADLQLAAPDKDQWVERWHLVTSPVWNTQFTGLAPVYESQQQNLVPVWHPWPLENVSLEFTRPQAVPGETITVQRVHQQTALGNRQRTSELKFDLECSLGSDFVIQLEPSVEVSSVRVSGQAIPVRRNEADLIIPVQPGTHSVEVAWRNNTSLDRVVTGEFVQLPVKMANITNVVQVSREPLGVMDIGSNIGAGGTVLGDLDFCDSGSDGTG